jgi:hypothetical protein
MSEGATTFVIAALGVLDLAQKPNFTSPTSFRNRNRISQLGRNRRNSRIWGIRCNRPYSIRGPQAKSTSPVSGAGRAGHISYSSRRHHL